MPLSDSDCAAKYKIMVLGNASVGKSSLLKCLLGKEFGECVLPTVATDFVRKMLEVDGALVELQIWDTAGQDRFHSMNKWQYRGVRGVALVYDVTDRQSFANLAYWLESINNEISNPDSKYETVPVVLLGNKCDLDTERKVQLQEGKKFAEKEMAFDFFETSARTGENVFNSFRKLACLVTEICNPEIMKSYHPNMIKEGHVPALQETRTIKLCNIVLIQWTKKKKYPSKTRKSKREKNKTNNEQTVPVKTTCCCIL